MSLLIREVDPTSRDAQMLMQSLDEDLRMRYPGAVIQGIDVEGWIGAGGVFLVGYEDDLPVACGGLRPIADGSLEVKRMFVTEASRRRGHAREMLTALEDQARGLGVQVIRLETGDRQPEAISLYQRAGYRSIPCYDAYSGSPHSHCFEKQLTPTDRVP
jgi:GNAT superfamily N-acetyltransferase